VNTERIMRPEDARLLHAKWSNHDIELEESSRVVPPVYLRKNPVNVTQWATALELALPDQGPMKGYFNHGSAQRLSLRQLPRGGIHPHVQGKEAGEAVQYPQADLQEDDPAKILGLEDKGPTWIVKHPA
jgi:hypothetical protein